MSNEILDWSVIDYKTTVEHLLQQRGSKLRGAVMEDSYHGKSGAAVNQVGAVTAQLRTSRHADTPLIETPHDKRWVFPLDYEWADLIDDVDKLKIIADPTSPYAINGAMAIGRAMDDEIIAKATATALTGEDGTTSTTFPAGQTAATTAGGLTVAKLREAMQLLIAAEVDVDNEPLFCAIGAQQRHDLAVTDLQRDPPQNQDDVVVDDLQVGDFQHVPLFDRSMVCPLPGTPFNVRFGGRPRPLTFGSQPSL